MFKVLITKEDVKEAILELETEDRHLARAWAVLCEETPLNCVVTEEVSPRVVKFKGLD